MQHLFLDAETYYSKEYSLRKMTPVEYILDPRFEMIGLAVQKGNHAPYWIEGPEVPYFFSMQNPDDTAMVTYNALFDACIFAWRYGFVPKLIVDAMAMVRARYGAALKSMSLATTAEYMNVGTKGKAIGAAEGMNLAAIKSLPGYYRYEYIPYALNDVTLCASIYNKLIREGFPLDELLVQDMVLRCAVNPKFVIDTHVVAEHLAAVKAQKMFLLDSLPDGMDKASLMSNLKFAHALRNHGVEPAMKVSSATGLETFAFAKTDKFMVDLESHPDPMVQVLAAARLGTKSTLEETRAQRLLDVANLYWPHGRQCSMPIPLRNNAAHTHRLGGEWKLNFQNLPRKSPLRHSLKAPPGYTVVAADAKQIEARGVAALCGQDDLVKAFEEGVDVYASFASTVFNKPIDPKVHVAERFIGKTCILGLGFQSGAATLQNSLRVQSKLQLGRELKVTEAEAQEYVRTYRTTYYKIPRAWRTLQTNGIKALLGEAKNYKWGGCVFRPGKVLLPSGLELYYHNIVVKPIAGLEPALDHDDSMTVVFGDATTKKAENNGRAEYTFTFAGVTEKIYGGKLLENIIQSLAREITMSAAVRICKRTGEELALQVHDELVFVVPDEKVELVKQVMKEEMCRRPGWAPGWPLAVDEPKTGKTYGDVK